MSPGPRALLGVGGAHMRRASLSPPACRFPLAGLPLAGVEEDMVARDAAL